MQEFDNTLKLYFFRDKNLASFSIRTSRTHVLTFYIDGEGFERILGHAADPNGVETGAHFVQRKRQYLRWSFSHGNGMQENLRISLGQWDQLVADFRTQQATVDGPLITCVVI